MHDIRIGEAHVEPEGIETRFPRDGSLQCKERGTQVLQRAKVDGLHLRVESAENSERRPEDVEDASA
jgi:hypothetical protein